MNAPTLGKIPGNFAPAHAWDRNFHLLLLTGAWLGILMGFGGDIAQHLSAHRPAYPLIVHLHGIVFTGWLVLFTVQVLLVRRQKLAVHRRLGEAMGWVAGGMLILGPATALHMQHLHAGQPGDDPAFLSIQFTDMLGFAGLFLAGMLLRRSPAAHKRLMLLGTIYITDAGFARWLGDSLAARFGSGFGGFWATLFLPPMLLMLAMGVYDLATRRRLHPAYLAGLA